MTHQDFIPLSTYFWIVPAVFIAPWIFIGVVKLVEIAAWGVEGAAEQNAYLEFMRSGRDRGLDYREIMAEWDVRAELVRLRGEASDAVRAAPMKDWHKEMTRCVNWSFERVGRQNPALLPAYARMIKPLLYSDILYPDAARLVDKFEDRELSTNLAGMGRNRRGALRIVR